MNSLLSPSLRDWKAERNYLAQLRTYLIPLGIEEVNELNQISEFDSLAYFGEEKRQIGIYFKRESYRPNLSSYPWLS